MLIVLIERESSHPKHISTERELFLKAIWEVSIECLHSCYTGVFRLFNFIMRPTIRRDIGGVYKH